MIHFEFFSMAVKQCSSVRCRDEDRLNELIAERVRLDINIVNLYVMTIEAGDMHRVASPDITAVKKCYNQMLLLNPGKVICVTVVLMAE